MFTRGRDVTLAARRRRLTLENRVRSQVSPCEICVQSVALVKVFFSEYLRFPVSIMPSVLRLQRIRRKKGETWESCDAVTHGG
jgi:hypothetical protein